MNDILCMIIRENFPIDHARIRKCMIRDLWSSICSRPAFLRHLKNPGLMPKSNEPSGFDHYYNVTLNSKSARTLAYAHLQSDTITRQKILETGSQKELDILQMKTLMSLEAKVAALQTLIAKK